MTDQSAPFQPGRQPTTIPFRSRGEFAGYKAFGSGRGAVLIDVGTGRRLRSAARLATRERRVARGLLFGRRWTDDQGNYLVIDAFLEAPAGENGGEPGAAGGAGQFTLSEADLRLLRSAAARMYPASLEAGWWRTLPALGEFGQRDLATQAALVGPDGVGLLVYGSGVHWGTAYLGPDGHAPDTAGTLVTATDASAEPPPAPEPAAEPGPEPEPGPGPDPGPELVDITAGEHLTEEPIPLADNVTAVRGAGLTDAAAGRPLRQQVKRQARRRSSGRARRRAPGPAGRRTAPRARVSSWGRGRAPGQAVGGAPAPEVPNEVRLVVGALAIAAVLAAIIVGILLHSLIATVIIAAIVVPVILASAWLSRRW